MDEISKNERSMHKFAESVQNKAIRLTAEMLKSQGCTTGEIDYEGRKPITVFNTKKDHSDMGCIVEAFEHIEPDSIITIYGEDYPVKEHRCRHRKLFLAAYDISTGYIFFFYLPDFKNNEDVYQIHGSAFRAIYGRIGRGASWKTIITR